MEKVDHVTASFRNPTRQVHRVTVNMKAAGAAIHRECWAGLTKGAWKRWSLFRRPGPRKHMYIYIYIRHNGAKRDGRSSTALHKRGNFTAGYPKPRIINNKGARRVGLVFRVFYNLLWDPRRLLNSTCWKTSALGSTKDGKKMFSNHLGLGSQRPEISEDGGTSSWFFLTSLCVCVLGGGCSVHPQDKGVW